MIRRRPRPGESPQQGGRAFERLWARLFGVEPVKGSGNQWYARQDVGDVAFLWQCKLTEAASFSISKALMKEVEAAITGQGGSGGEVIPGIAACVENEVYVTLRAEDFLRLVKAESAMYLTPSRGEQKRARARVPSLLRDEGE